jgi:hypothetical protein
MECLVVYECYSYETALLLHNYKPIYDWDDTLICYPYPGNAAHVKSKVNGDLLAIYGVRYFDAPIPNIPFPNCDPW